MRVSRAVSLGLLAGVAGPWAAVLVLGGLWLLDRAPGLGVLGPAEWRVAGVTAVAAGHMVFTVCIADRLFPRAGRAVGPWLEVPACVTLFVGVLWVAAAVVAG